MTLLLSVAFSGLAWAAAAEPGTEEFAPGRGPRLGLLVEPSSAVGLPPASRDPSASPPLARLVARWAEVERVPGTHDWTVLGPAIESLLEAGYRPVLALAGTPSPTVAGSMEAWLEFVRSAARNFAGRVSVFEVGEGGSQPGDEDARIQALVLKQSALAIRAEARARGAEVWLAQGALPLDALDWQKTLWTRDLAAYFDILPVVVEVGTDLTDRASRFRGFFEASLQQAPAPALWAYVSSSTDPWDAPSLAAVALTVGASAALFEPSGTDQVHWGLRLQGTLDAGYVPAALGQLRLEADGGPAPTPAKVLGRFFHEEDFTTLVVYRAPPTNTTIDLVVDSSLVRNARLLDLSTGETRRVGSTPVSGGRALRIDPAAAPGAAMFQRQAVTPGFELSPEDLEVATERGLTAEEIIAQYQLLQRDQDDRLERWTAKGQIDFHFRFAQGATSIDVTIDSRYFWERGGQLEWEQKSYRVNGNRVPWKNIPEIPLIQPEKVITLPLDLTLDRTYTYRLVGRERIAGREAYVLEFRPTTPDVTRSLYQGKLWIDTGTFARLKASVIQENLQAPVLSNEEVDRFEEQVGPHGKPYWMFSYIDGQQILSAGGRTFVVRRELTFSEFEINPPRGDFEARRQEAYESDNQMLRDTDTGFRYLERQEDGSRTVKEKADTSQLFAAVGAFKDGSQDNVVPLGGVNYFNYDLGGFQVNALFAGVVGFFTASKPEWSGRKISLTADAGFNVLKSSDKVFVALDESLAERIETRSQVLDVRIGLPAGQFVRFNLVGGVAYRQFFDSDEGVGAQTALGGFVLPADHAEWSGTLETEFNRRGYSLTGSISRAFRSEWEAWGLQENGVFVDPEPVEESFTRWSLRATKEWYLPKFQKIRGGIDYLGGSDLDRFSQYQFSFFGNDRLNGFSGTGVRFDRGLIARVGYAFNLFGVVRFDAAWEAARVEPPSAADPEQDFSGIGLSANFPLPWKMLVNFNYGYALQSDIPALEGEQEFLLFVFKLF